MTIIDTIKSKISEIFISESSKKGDLGLVIVSLSKRKQNWQFEVISKSYFDTTGEEYQSEDAFHMYMMHEEAKGEDVSHIRLMVSEEELTSEVGYRIGDSVNMDNAKICGFGVVRFITDEHRGQEFMFAIKDFDIPLQIFAYKILTHGSYDKKVWETINNEDGLNYLKIVVGEDVFDMILEKITS